MMDEDLLYCITYYFHAVEELSIDLKKPWAKMDCCLEQCHREMSNFYYNWFMSDIVDKFGLTFQTICIGSGSTLTLNCFKSDSNTTLTLNRTHAVLIPSNILFWGGNHNDKLYPLATSAQEMILIQLWR